MSEARDAYTVLAVSPSATQAEITHAYRQKVRDHHPDTRGTPRDGIRIGGDELQEVLRAYTILRDPITRAAYDRTRRRAPARRTVTSTPTGHGGTVDIPVSHESRRRHVDQQRPPLWAGPVRRHR